MNSRVFQPLNLTSTYLETPSTPNEYVPGYQLVGEDQLVSVAGSNSSFAWAAGGVVSSIDNLGRLAPALFTGELLTPASYEEMFTFVGDSHRDAVEYGMGVVRLQTPSGPVEVISGGAAGYTAVGFHFKDQSTTIVGMFNRNDADPAFQAAVEDYLELLTP